MVKPLDNEIYIDENDCIQVIFHGHFGPLSARSMLAKIQELITELKSAGKPVNIVADVRDMESHSLAVRQLGLEARDSLPYDRLAIVIAPEDAYKAKISEIMSKVAKRKYGIGHFNDIASARNWLRE